MDDRLARAQRWRGALAGQLGAGAALAALELVAAVDATGVSVVEAVDHRVIDGFAASLKDLAVALFGTSDKVALEIGTVLIALGIGALLGTQAERRPNVVVAGYAAFGAFGIWACAVDALASLVLGVVACVIGALVGAFVTLGLAGRWEHVADEAEEPAGGPVTRRAVLVNGAVAAAVIAFGLGLGRSIRSSARSAADTVSRAIPRAKTRIATPPDTFDEGPDAIAGITPYVTPTDDFYRIDTSPYAPVVDVDSWKLTIDGLVERPTSYTFDDLLARDLVEVPITMLCVSNEVGGGLVGTARWTGVRLADLLEEVGLRPEAEQLLGESVDGFTAGFPVEAGTDGRDALVVVGMNGRTLPREHGYPVRLVVPGLYGYVSATKWITRLEATTWDEQGYWITRGWSRLGPIKISSRIDVPRSGEDLAAGTVAVAGVAWAPTIGIRAVEVKVDDGPWQEAKLGPVASEDTWVQWWLPWDATPGSHTLAVRAIDADGEVQVAAEAPPAPDGATGHHTIEVDVA